VRRHPHLYEINTWPWLAELSRRYGRRLSLGTVPGEVWDGIRGRGMDLVYLMGIWTRSAIGRRIARSDPGAWASFDGATSAWHIPGVVGSAFCISGYEPDPALGSLDDLDRARAELNRRGMRLIVDFIPNHFGFDHPWTTSHPQRFVQGSEQDFRESPTSFRLVEQDGNEPRYIARARDPYFLPWSDVAQIDYSKADTRAAMAGELRAIAEHADGARCDMAMLVLSDVFATTWRRFVDPPAQAREFWADARDAVPGFLLIAEVYWDMEWRLQELGFDYTYDKRLYDRLVHEDAASVNGHLRADAAYQDKSARFIENHDEPRSAAVFGARTAAAAAVAATVPGMRFFYDGQFEGRRIRLPMQLGDDVRERIDGSIDAFYRRLLPAIDEPAFHDGEWALCAVESVDHTSADLIAWCWKIGDQRRLVIVNLGTSCAQGRLVLAAEFLGSGERFVFDDALRDQRGESARADLTGAGFVARVPGGHAQILSITAAADREA
jgi:hypothetical protein